MKLISHSNWRQRPGCAAYTLAEVMVAVLVAGIAATSGYSGFFQGFQLLQSTRENLRATQILQDRAEIVRLYTWSQLNTSGFIALNFIDYQDPNHPTNNSAGVTYYGSVAISGSPLTESYAADIKQVTFQLNWTNHNIPHQRQLTTFVSRYGLHNYLYGAK